MSVHDETPAETIRRAIEQMRARAEGATGGPWEVYQTAHAEAWVCEKDRGAFGVVSKPATGKDDYGAANAEHIASWHPAVALAAADLLERSAIDLWAHGPLCGCDDGCFDCDDALWMPHARAALRLARTYLGETP